MQSNISELTNGSEGCNSGENLRMDVCMDTIRSNKRNCRMNTMSLLHVTTWYTTRKIHEKTIGSKWWVIVLSVASHVIVLSLFCCSRIHKETKDICISATTLLSFVWHPVWSAMTTTFLATANFFWIMSPVNQLTVGCSVKPGDLSHSLLCQHFKVFMTQPLGSHTA